MFMYFFTGIKLQNFTITGRKRIIQINSRETLILQKFCVKQTSVYYHTKHHN